jgi:fermentation-respiration switch protein FrsA (DUF1100 family)
MGVGPWLIIGAMVGLTLFVDGSIQITRIPFFAVPYTPKDFGWPFEPVVFSSPEGLKLEGWFVPAKRPSSDTIIILHGMGSNHGDMLPNTACLYDAGLWNLFYFNFRGHGGSEGTITSLGPLELGDLRSALGFLKAHKAEAVKRLAIYGHSLGAAVAIVAAAEIKELLGVAAESPFASISKTVRHFGKIYHGIPYWPFVPLAVLFASFRLGLKLGKFNPVEAIGKISPRPVYLIHGARDLRMPMADFELLWAAAEQPKEQWVVPEADHGDPWMIDRSGYEQRLVAFFKKVLSKREENV